MTHALHTARNFINDKKGSTVKKSSFELVWNNDTRRVEGHMNLDGQVYKIFELKEGRWKQFLGTEAFQRLVLLAVHKHKGEDKAWDVKKRFYGTLTASKLQEGEEVIEQELDIYDLKRRKMRLLGREVLVKSPEGGIYQVRHVKMFCEEWDLSVEKLNAVIRKAIPQYKGWTLVEREIKKGGGKVEMKRVSVRLKPDDVVVDQVCMNCYAAKEPLLVQSPTGTIYRVYNVKAFAAEHDVSMNGIARLRTTLKGEYEGWKRVEE